MKLRFFEKKRKIERTSGEMNKLLDYPKTENILSKVSGEKVSNTKTKEQRKNQTNKKKIVRTLYDDQIRTTKQKI
jgi:hypothetical protein